MNYKKRCNFQRTDFAPIIINATKKIWISPKAVEVESLENLEMVARSFQKHIFFDGEVYSCLTKQGQIIFRKCK